MKYLVRILAACTGVLSAQVILSSGSVEGPPKQQTTAEVKPEDRCAIEGKILNAQTGEPLKKAHVVLTPAQGSAQDGYAATSDAAGHFLISDINPGSYRLAADRNGFVMAWYGAKTSSGFGGMGGTTLVLSKGQKLKDLVLKMPPQGIVTGKVVDEDSEPLENVQIMFMRPMYHNGKKSFIPNGAASTDDRGEFRAHGLAPGRYYVCAVVQGRGMVQQPLASQGTQTGYAPTFYPGTFSLTQASTVGVASGAEVSGIDFRLTPVHAVRISGKVGGNTAGQQTIVMLTSHDNSLMPWASMKHAMTDDKGNFVFNGITPGSYQITAPDRQTQALVEVGDSDVTGVQVVSVPANDLNGTLRAEAGADIKGKSMRVFLQPDGGLLASTNNGPAEVKDDGTFQVKQVQPEHYRVNVFPLPDSAYVKSVRFGDTETSNGSIDLTKGAGGEIAITIAGDGGQVDGAVQNEKQEPVTSASVVLVPDQRDDAFSYKTTTVDQNGHFTIRGIKPGSYKLFAWDQVEWGQYEDPDFLKPWEDRGEAITIHQNDKTTKDLKLLLNGSE